MQACRGSTTTIYTNRLFHDPSSTHEATKRSRRSQISRSLSHGTGKGASNTKANALSNPKSDEPPPAEVSIVQSCDCATYRKLNLHYPYRFHFFGYPSGFPLCHFQALAIISSRLLDAVHFSSSSAFFGSAMTVARSPGLRSPITYGIFTLDAFSKPATISRTDTPLPVPRLWVKQPVGGSFSMLGERWTSTYLATKQQHEVLLSLASTPLQLLLDLEVDEYQRSSRPRSREMFFSLLYNHSCGTMGLEAATNI